MPNPDSGRRPSGGPPAVLAFAGLLGACVVAAFLVLAPPPPVATATVGVRGHDAAITLRGPGAPAAAYWIVREAKPRAVAALEAGRAQGAGAGGDAARSPGYELGHQLGVAFVGAAVDQLELTPVA